ncbi:DNA-binding protein [Methanosarcina sp. Ant1]|nr:DNA-binding protein [Methanosarcina sp. Ant1]
MSPAAASVVSAENKLTGCFYRQYKNSIEGFLTKVVETPSLIFAQEFSSPLTESRVGVNKHIEIMNPFFFLAAGILAGINPCLLAVMAFLASVILVQQGGRKEMLKITLGFSTGIFAIHMFAGISILSTVNFLPEIRGSFIIVTILLTAFLGLWHIFDAYWLKKHARSTFKTPNSLKNFMSGMNEKNLLLLSFLSGGMYFLVKAPCVGAVYLSILSILVTKTDMTKGIAYMGLYNIGLLIPIVALGLLLSFGLSPKEVTEFREKWRVEIRLTTGLILISLALLMQLRII